MTAIHASLKFLAVLLFACSCSKQSQQTGCRVDVATINVPGILDTLRRYRSQSFDGFGILTIDCEYSNDSTFLFLSSTRGLGEMPCHYLMLDEKPVLVYSGAESVLEFSEAYARRIHELIDPFVEKFEVDENGIVKSVPSNFNPIIWKVSVVQGKIVDMTIID